ncbi:MAG TPA: nucleotidyl transferase AbiEii/AbiGii toxin family protein, partial [Spirochaetota bacterium]|nr:nucleotidyl transferase AbiEii/AbiGii toxin family protein [Spirochaetota bacterium]
MLNCVKNLNLPFYLTGGTALSRGYFNHRYSDDIDLFTTCYTKYFFNL